MLTVTVATCLPPAADPASYHQGLVYSLDPTDLDTLQMFVKVQLDERRVATELKPVPVWYDKMVLVCTHGSRDKRCGRVGPQVLIDLSLTPKFV